RRSHAWGPRPPGWRRSSARSPSETYRLPGDICSPHPPSRGILETAHDKPWRTMTAHDDEPTQPADPARDVVSRVLARAGTALQADGVADHELDGDQLDREERSALRRVAGLSTELEDVTEVEYRRLRLERVVLIGIWSGPDPELAEV